MEIKSALFPMVDVRRTDKPIPSVKVVMGYGKNAAEGIEFEDEGNEDFERTAAMGGDKAENQAADAGPTKSNRGLDLEGETDEEDTGFMTRNCLCGWSLYALLSVLISFAFFGLQITSAVLAANVPAKSQMTQAVSRIFFGDKVDEVPLYFEKREFLESYIINLQKNLDKNSDSNSMFWRNNRMLPHIRVQAFRSELKTCYEQVNRPGFEKEYAS